MPKENKQWVVWLDGDNVSVSEEIYRAFYRPKWREAKQEKLRRDWEYSLDCLNRNDSKFVSLDSNVEEVVIGKLLLEKLHIAINMLTDQERKLIIALFFHGITGDELAREYGVSKQIISYRKSKIISKLRDLLSAENEC